MANMRLAWVELKPRPMGACWLRLMSVAVGRLLVGN